MKCAPNAVGFRHITSQSKERPSEICNPDVAGTANEFSMWIRAFVSEMFLTTQSSTDFRKLCPTPTLFSPP